MRKIVQLEERFYGTGEPTLLVVARSERGRWYTEKAASYRREGVTEKSASAAFEYIKNVEPRPGSTIVLINALGAFETYDDNRNGDAFPERPYRVGKKPACGHAQCARSDGWIRDDETIKHHYKSFERYGKVYKHHVNKDPANSYGNVMQSFLNDYMHRVELLAELINERDPQLVARINAGEFPAASMGCQVRWDVCATCGHHAPTRADYCDHLKFEMRKIDPRTGVRNCALNPSCRWFDISIVLRPADETGYMLKKVAAEGAVPELSSAARGERVAEFESKQAVVRKLSDIQKEIVGVVSAKRKGPDVELIRQYRKHVLPHAKSNAAGPAGVRTMARYPISEVASTLASKDAALCVGDFVEVFMKRAGFDVPSEHVDRAAAVQPLVLAAYCRYPGAYEKAAEYVTMDASRVSQKLTDEMGPWLRQELHDAGGPLGRGAPAGPGYAYEASSPARTDVLTMTDPYSGETYRTTRGAAQHAHRANYRSMLGGAAALGGAYALGLSLLPRSARPGLGTRLLVGMPLGYATMRKLRGAFPPYEGDYPTDQGYVLPGNAEFSKSGRFSMPTLLDKLAADYVSRTGGMVPGRLDAALLLKVAARDGEDELVRVMASPDDLDDKVAAMFGPSEEWSDASGEATPTLPFDRLVEKLGTLLVPSS